MLASMRWLASVGIAFAACGYVPVDRRPPDPPGVYRGEPNVDMACVQSGVDGTLLDGLPAELSGFTVSRQRDGVHLHREGRELSANEGKALHEAFDHGAFEQRGLVMGSMAADGFHPDDWSADHCTDAVRDACFKLTWHVCQTSLDLLASRALQDLERSGLADAAISIDVGVMEASGPWCKNGPSCPPSPHYSVEGVYQADAPRYGLDRGSGVCRDDGDCVGGGNMCRAWYLAGAAEAAYYHQDMQPEWCGCVAARCRWFAQQWPAFE
jgi:hypothetical protein